MKCRVNGTRVRAILAIAAGGILLLASSAQAATVTINATLFGRYQVDPDVISDPFDPGAINNPSNYSKVASNYRVGYPNSGTLSRAYYIFNIPSDLAAQVGGPITSALLRLNTYAVDAVPQFLDFRLYDLLPVTITRIQSGAPGNELLIYNDLGKGNAFSPGGPGTYVSSSLPIGINKTTQTNIRYNFDATGALSSIISAIGGSFGLGGAVPLDGYDGAGSDIYAFLTSAPPGSIFIPQLIISDQPGTPGPDITPPTIPEPSGLALWGIGAAGLGLFVRRRQRSA